ncbi:MAG: DNA-binding protein [Prevotella sp.]|nr:DNA-binding protein [Prevotella sp.]
MYAKYIKQEIPDLNGTGQTQAYYRMELTPKSYEEFVSQCAREGHTDESTILGVLSLVSEKLALNMAEGFSVKLNGIGTFNAKLGVRDDMLQDAFEEGERSHNAKSIMVTGVAYRADNDLIWNTSRKCTLERGGVSRLRKPELSLEERIQKAKEFLEKNSFMRVPDYVRLTGLSRTTATQELRRLALDPTSGITSRGIRSQKFYVLCKP